MYNDSDFGWWPGVERRVEESVIANLRLAKHLFSVMTATAPGEEVRVTGTGAWLAAERRAAFQRSYVQRDCWQDALCRSLLGLLVRFSTEE